MDLMDYILHWQSWHRLDEPDARDTVTVAAELHGPLGVRTRASLLSLTRQNPFVQVELCDLSKSADCGKDSW
eukprot:1816334-Rhodomonas_salina.2